jgi:hypothetical protein
MTITVLARHFRWAKTTRHPRLFYMSFPSRQRRDKFRPGIHLPKSAQAAILLFESASWRIENSFLEFRTSNLCSFSTPFLTGQSIFTTLPRRGCPDNL